MPLLPQLQAHARVLRRSADSVQIGLVDGAGIVVSGLHADEIEQLTQLARRARAPRARSDIPGLQEPDPAAASGADLGVGRGDGQRTYPAGERAEAADGTFVDSTRLASVLSALREHHLVVEQPTRVSELRAHAPEEILAFAPDAAARACAYGLPDDGYSIMRRRRACRVLVDGAGRLADDIAACLREGVVGVVDSGAMAAGTVDLALRSGRGASPDLVILLASGGLPFHVGEPWRSRDIPHLPVVIDGPSATVGPLVGGIGPCLRCLDLYRTDRDPLWPALLTQLVPDRPVPMQPVEAETGLRALVAGLTATFAYACLDDHELPVGLASAVCLPSPAVSHYRWRTHPKCQACRERVTMEW